MTGSNRGETHRRRAGVNHQAASVRNLRRQASALGLHHLIPAAEADLFFVHDLESRSRSTIGIRLASGVRPRLAAVTTHAQKVVLGTRDCGFRRSVRPMMSPYEVGINMSNSSLLSSERFEIREPVETCAGSYELSHV